MKLQFGWMSLLLLIMCAFVSCADNVDDEEEYVDWRKKNEYAFIKQLEEAKDSIAQAREKYGDDWEAHCPWRVYRTYAQDERVNGKAIDSICMKKVSGEAKSAPAFYTDSIGVNYMLRLQPSTSYPDGKVADFSGPIPNESSVFHPDFCSPSKLAVSNTVEGFTTAAMHMGEGERWLVYIPHQLGYGSTASTAVPSYSMLTFDMQIVKIYRQ